MRAAKKMWIYTGTVEPLKLGHVGSTVIHFGVKVVYIASDTSGTGRSKLGEAPVGSNFLEARHENRFFALY